MAVLQMPNRSAVPDFAPLMRCDLLLFLESPLFTLALLAIRKKIKQVTVFTLSETRALFNQIK